MKLCRIHVLNLHTYDPPGLYKPICSGVCRQLKFALALLFSDRIFRIGLRSVATYTVQGGISLDPSNKEEELMKLPDVG